MTEIGNYNSKNDLEQNLKFLITLSPNKIIDMMEELEMLEDLEKFKESLDIINLLF